MSTQKTKKLTFVGELRPAFFRIEDVAAVTQMSPTSVRRLIKSGEIRTVKFGRLVRIHESEMKRIQELGSG